MRLSMCLGANKIESRGRGRGREKRWKQNTSRPSLTDVHFYSFASRDIWFVYTYTYIHICICICICTCIWNELDASIDCEYDDSFHFSNLTSSVSALLVQGSILIGLWLYGSVIDKTLMIIGKSSVSSPTFLSPSGNVGRQCFHRADMGNTIQPFVFQHKGLVKKAEKKIKDQNEREEDHGSTERGRTIWWLRGMIWVVGTRPWLFRCIVRLTSHPGFPYHCINASVCGNVFWWSDRVAAHGWIAH